MTTEFQGFCPQGAAVQVCLRIRYSMAPWPWAVQRIRYSMASAVDDLILTSFIFGICLLVAGSLGLYFFLQVYYACIEDLFTHL